MKKRIIEICDEVLPNIDFSTKAKLWDDGILDSISLITLVSELSFEFGVEFELDQLTPENFNSIDAIVNTIKMLKE